jgi:hypothetical protein
MKEKDYTKEFYKGMLFGGIAIVCGFILQTRIIFDLIIYALLVAIFLKLCIISGIMARKQ